MIRLGEQQARESLHSAIRQVCAAAKISPDRIAAVCVGATGAARPEIAETIRKIVAESIPGNSAAKIEVVADTIIALEAAFGPGPGVIVIAGTGSVAYGRDLAGHRADGQGDRFGIPAADADSQPPATAGQVGGSPSPTRARVIGSAAALSRPFCARAIKESKVEPKIRAERRRSQRWFSEHGSSPASTNS